MKQPEVWGHGSIAIFLVIVAIILLGPLFMGPISPPGIPLLLVFPVIIAVVIILLIVFSN
ncbi:hypothetical protein TanjilG_27155 [Lupinus angustifolius]|uniref:Transmembrane protein n=1 Tax=Lupinus angustifolius TaxID=3871 RepID=A0A4P1QW50_LUPAN|nr:hypothetical protein TanjilG_27155 [Lupinus angustifolius]